MSEPEKKPRRRIKKVKGHGGHHGGAWKVAYADFVTAMMALFLVLWLVSQADTKVKQAIANYFRSPGVFSTMEGGILGGPAKVSKEPSPLTSKDDEQALFSAGEVLKKNFSERQEFARLKDQVRIDITEEGLRIQILDKAERVSFNSASARLNPEAQSIIGEIARAICQLPNPVMIGGHTDRHVFPAESVYTNWELSADRANAARRELEKGCVQPSQIRRVVGYADTDLAVPADPYAAANRRISIVVMRLAPPPGAEGERTDVVEKPSGKGKQKAEKHGETNGPAEKEVTIPLEKIKGATGKGHAAAHEGEGHAGERKSSTDQSHHTTPSAEQRRMSHKLASEGSVSVGEPDRVPAKAKRSQER